MISLLQLLRLDHNLDALVHTIATIVVGVLMVSWALEHLLRQVERALDGLVPVADRLGDIGAAWRRLVTAIRHALDRWRG